MRNNQAKIKKEKTLTNRKISNGKDILERSFCQKRTETAEIAKECLPPHTTWRKPGLTIAKRRWFFSLWKRDKETQIDPPEQIAGRSRARPKTSISSARVVKVTIDLPHSRVIHFSSVRHNLNPEAVIVALPANTNGPFSSVVSFPFFILVFCLPLTDK